MNDEDVEMLRYVAAMLDVGLPPVAFLQLARVYGQAVAQIADAEVRLVHLYVHEPLMRAGVPSVEIAEEMEGMDRELIPFVVPLHGLHPRPPAQPLHRAGPDRPHRGRARRGRSARRAACGWRSPSPTSRATRG